MNVFKAKSPLVFILASAGTLGLTLFAADCGCTMVGCESGAAASIEIETDLTTLDGSKVEMCRNGVCTEGILRDGEQLSVFCEFPNGSQQCFGQWTESGTLDIDFQFFIDTDNDDFEDGDSYAFRVFDPADETVTIAEVEGQATYSESQPNGAMCGPTCYNASIE